MCSKKVTKHVTISRDMDMNQRSPSAGRIGADRLDIRYKVIANSRAHYGPFRASLQP
jgi:hypothetical protein